MFYCLKKTSSLSPQRQFKHSLDDLMYTNESRLNIFDQLDFIKLNQIAFKSIQHLKLLALTLVNLFLRKNNDNETNGLISKKVFKFVFGLLKETTSPASPLVASSKFNVYFLMTFLTSLKCNCVQLTWKEYDFCLNTFDLIFQENLGPVSLIKDPKLAFVLVKSLKKFIARLLNLTCTESLLLLKKSALPSKDFIENLEKSTHKYMNIVEEIYSESSFQNATPVQYLYNSIDCQTEIIDLICKCVKLTRLKIVCINFKLNLLQEEESEANSDEIQRVKQLKKDLVKRQNNYSNKLVTLIHSNESFRIKYYAENKFIKCAFQRDLFKKCLFRLFNQKGLFGKNHYYSIF